MGCRACLAAYLDQSSLFARCSPRFWPLGSVAIARGTTPSGQLFSGSCSSSCGECYAKIMMVPDRNASLQSHQRTTSTEYYVGSKVGTLPCPPDQASQSYIVVPETTFVYFAFLPISFRAVSPCHCLRLVRLKIDWHGSPRRVRHQTLPHVHDSFLRLSTGRHRLSTGSRPQN